MGLAAASLASAAAELMNRGTSPFPLKDSSSFCFTVGPLYIEQARQMIVEPVVREEERERERECVCVCARHVHACVCMYMYICWSIEHLKTLTVFLV